MVGVYMSNERKIPMGKRGVPPINKKRIGRMMETHGVLMKPKPPESSKEKSPEITRPRASRRLPEFHSNYLTPDNQHGFIAFIGAKNPYAMINRQRVLNGDDPLEWDLMDVDQTTKEILAFMNPEPKGTLKPMAKKAVLTLDQCFDPIYKSRVFPSKAMLNKALLRSTIPVAELTPKHFFTSAGIQDKPCVQNPVWVDSTVNWAPKGTLYNSPIQGTGCNCWFIAALCSIAWTDGTYFSVPPNEGIFVLMNNPNNTPQENLDNSFIYPDNSLPVKGDTTPASTTFAWSTSKYKGMWVPMLERAYAMRLKYPTDIPPEDDHPDICTCFGPGSPTSALYHLLGDANYKQFINNTADNDAAHVKWYAENDPLVKIVPTGGQGSGSLWDWLALRNCTNPVIPPATNIFRKTTFPTVAFTYGTQDPAISGTQIGTPNTTNPAPRGSGVTYNNDLFVASHSYSVLGTYSRTVGGVTTNYVLLRNPWGQVRTISKPMAGTYALDANETLPGFANNLWVPVTVNKVTTYMLQDGVFGVDFNKFALYFQGLAWV
jgi:hypothetical protein